MMKKILLFIVALLMFVGGFSQVTATDLTMRDITARRRIRITPGYGGLGYSFDMTGSAMLRGNVNVSNGFLDIDTTLRMNGFDVLLQDKSVDNLYIGYRNGGGTSSGSNNVAVGVDAQMLNTSGSNNTNIGSQANSYAMSSSYTTSVGSQAGLLSNGNNSMFLGYMSGRYVNSDSIIILNTIDRATAKGDTTLSPIVIHESYDMINQTINLNGNTVINGTYSLPFNDGSANEVMTTDGSGNVTWQPASGGSISDSSVLGDWVCGLSLSSVYQASSSLLVVAKFTSIDMSMSSELIGYTDASGTPITKVAGIGGGGAAFGVYINGSIIFPVKKGDYFKIEGSGAYNTESYCTIPLLNGGFNTNECFDSIMAHKIVACSPLDIEADSVLTDNLKVKSLSVINGTDTIQIDDDGINLLGTAAVYDDAAISGFNLPTGPTAPAFTTGFNGSSVLGAWYFQGATQDDLAFFNAQFQHKIKDNDTVHVHFHFVPTTTPAATDTVVFQLTYSWANIDSKFGTVTTVVKKIPIGSYIQWQHCYFELAEIPGATGNLSSIMNCSIRRLANSNISDNYAHDIGLLSIDMHARIDELGSKHETSE